MKATVNKDACIGCGQCTAICGEVFEIGAEGTAEVKVAEVPEEAKDTCVEAKDSCPTGAISAE